MKDSHKRWHLDETKAKKKPGEAPEAFAVAVAEAKLAGRYRELIKTRDEAGQMVEPER
jgi:hypothetical protein